MAYFPLQRGQQRYPVYPTMASQQTGPAYRAAQPGQVTLGGGNLPRFQHPSQYADESGSVSSQKTYPSLNSQCDLQLAIKSELSDILKTFTALSAQQFESIQSTLLAPAVPQSSQPSLFSTVHESLGLVPVLDGSASLWQCAKTGFSQFMNKVSTDVTQIAQQISTVKAENLKKGVLVMERASNIEKVLRDRSERTKSKKKKPKKKKRCECLLREGTKMKKADRNKALKEGTLLCTCKG